MGMVILACTAANNIVGYLISYVYIYLPQLATPSRGITSPDNTLIGGGIAIVCMHELALHFRPKGGVEVDLGQK